MLKSISRTFSLEIKTIVKLTVGFKKSETETVVRYTRTTAIIHRDFIANKLSLLRRMLCHSIYLQQKKSSDWSIPTVNGRFSPTDPESHDMRRVAAPAKTNRIAFNIFFFNRPIFARPRDLDALLFQSTTVLRRNNIGTMHASVLEINRIPVVNKEPR